MANIINLYKKIGTKDYKKIGLDVKGPFLSYDYEGKEIAIDTTNYGEIVISDIDSSWAPDSNNLKVKLEVKIDKPSDLFGPFGITNFMNTIGFGVHVFSNEAKFQYSENVGSIKLYSDQKNWTLIKEFPQGSLRGKVHFHLFMYLEKAVKKSPDQAELAGMILTENNLAEFVISVDGEGSSFPIGEYEEVGGPLWKLETYFTEPDTDIFNYDNVRVLFNTKHPVFLKVKEEKQKVSQCLMQEVMVEAMAMIINKVLFSGDIDYEHLDEAAPGSVLAAVQYWLDTFSVDRSDVISVLNSLRASISQMNLTGGNKDD